MKLKAGVNFHNRFDIVKNGEWVGFAENIILDQMYSKLCNLQSYFANIHFGVGTGAPTPTRTSLFSHLGTKAATTEEIIKAFPTGKWTRKITLNPEEYVGSTITEVGIAYGSTNTNLVTHAMIKDSEGNPLSITKTALDVIIIYATVFVTFSSGDVVFTNLMETNRLVDYLIGGTTLSAWQGFALYETPILTGSSTLLAVQNTDYPYVEKQYTAELANKKIKWSNRFQITEGNMDIGLLALRNILVAEVKNTNIFGSFDRTNVPLGVGDGVKTTFRIPNRFINNLVVKADGVVTSAYSQVKIDALYDVPLSVQNAQSITTIPSGNGQFFEVDPLEDVYYIVIYDSNSGPQQILVSFKEPIPKTIDVVRDSYGNQVNPQTTATILISSDYKFLRIDRGTSSTPRYTYISLEGNVFTLLGATAPVGVSWVGLTLSTAPAGYEISGFATGQVPKIKKIYEDAITDVVFNSPVANNVVITADYTTDCIPKTSDYVLDVTFEIQFGEGV